MPSLLPGGSTVDARRKNSLQRPHNKQYTSANRKHHGKNSSQEHDSSLLSTNPKISKSVHVRIFLTLPDNKEITSFSTTNISLANTTLHIHVHCMGISPLIMNYTPEASKGLLEVGVHRRQSSILSLKLKWTEVNIITQLCMKAHVYSTCVVAEYIHLFYVVCEQWLTSLPADAC